MNAHVSPQLICNLEHARRFLAKAVPWDGENFVAIITHELKDGKHLWGGRAVKTIDDAITAMQWFVSRSPRIDLYCCMSSQRVAQERTGKNGYKFHLPIRSQKNAVALKSIYADIDYKGGNNGYETEDDAINAIAAFIKAAGLPKPNIIVRSGGGCHLHFTLTQPLPPNEWKQLAHSFAEAGKHYGLKADWQVTIDSARILRIPGSTNNKKDVARPVTFGGILDFDYDPDRLSKILEPFKAALPASITKAALTFEQPCGETPRALAQMPLADELGANISREHDPVDLDDLAKVCGFIDEAIKAGGVNYTNPMWKLTTLIATFTDDARENAHRMGNKHPGYTKESTDEFFDRKERERAQKGLGFPSCAAVSGSGCTRCQSCRNYSAARSPLAALPRKVTVPANSPTVSWADPLKFTQVPVEEAVERINQEYFVLRPTGTIYREGADGELGALQKSAFKTAIGGRKAEFIDGNGKMKTTSAADAWHDSWRRREYEGIEYCPDPKQAKPSFKNVFRGWGLEPEPGDCNLVLDHIHKIVAGGDDEKTNYYLDWFADILQHPARKPGVALVLRGGQGTGKSVLVEIKRRLLGPQNVLITPDSDRILGRFNSAIMNKILLVGEEMLFAGDKSKTDKLKHLITGHTIPVEFKFGDVLTALSCHRLILTSNHEQVIQAASEERRYVTYDVSDARRGDSQYFSRLYAVSDGGDDKTAAALMHFLLSRDISGFRPWEAPRLFASDSAMQKQKLLSLSPPLMWLRDVLDAVHGQGAAGDVYHWDGGLPCGPKKECKLPAQIVRPVFIDAFRTWCVKARPHGASEFTGSPERFWREIHKVIPKARTSKQNSLGQRSVAILLSDLQANFESFLRGERL